MGVARIGSEAPIDLITAPQDLTTNIERLGPVIATNAFNQIGLWLDYLINDSTGFQVYLFGTDSVDSTDFYNLPILTPNPAVVNVEPEVRLFTNNNDTKLVQSFPLLNVVPFIQFGVSVQVEGATGAQIQSARYTIGQF